jgi:uncharacterized protein (TIGR02246 family)
MQTLTDPTTLVTATFATLERAWNAADGPGYGAPFADEADFVNVRGEQHRGGPDYIGRAHQGIFDSIYAGSTVRYEVDVARSLAPGVVLAVAQATLDAPSGPLQGVSHARLTVVLTEQDGRWVISAFHNTLVA